MIRLRDVRSYMHEIIKLLRFISVILLLIGFGLIIYKGSILLAIGVFVLIVANNINNAIKQ